MNNVKINRNNVLITKVPLKLSDYFSAGNFLKVTQYGKPNLTYSAATGAINTLDPNTSLPPGTSITVFGLGTDRDLTAQFYPDGTVYDTELDFTTSGLVTGPGGMTVNIGAPSSIVKFRYKKRLTITDPANMTGDMYNGSTEIGLAISRMDYNNDPFEILLANGTVKHGNLKDVSQGNILLTT